MSKDIARLLQTWVEQGPRRQAEVAELLKDSGLDAAFIQKELAVKLGKPDADSASLPTFDPKVDRPVSPMLAARFQWAGTVKDGSEKWLSPRDMRKAITQPKVQKVFASLAEHWENSAPAKYPKSRISVFSVNADAPEDITLLAWPEKGSGEPRIHRYHGQSESVFDDLAAFLRWATTL